MLFSIVIIEILTRNTPYPGIDGMKVALANSKSPGMRPDIPNICPPNLASLMQRCWAENPDDRPFLPKLLQN